VLSVAVELNDENLEFVTVTVPPSKKTYTKAELAKLAKQLKPRIDNPKAKRIKQGNTAIFHTKYHFSYLRLRQKCWQSEER
jgi:hypothetical protein